MAAYTKYQQFVEDVCKGRHVVSTDTLRVLLTNTAPNVADTVVDTTTTPCTIKSTSNASEIAAGNGYTKKGIALTVTTSSQTTGTMTLAANKAVWTAAGGSFPTARYVSLYNDSNANTTTATRGPIAYWDYGAGGFTLNDTETFTVMFNSTDPGTIFTMT
jgi:hypothetical protein